MQHHDGYKVKTSWMRQRPDVRIGLTVNIHLGEKKKKPFQHNTDRDDDFADTDNIQWADNTHSILCTSNPYVYMGLKWVMTRHFTSLHFHVLMFLTCTTVGGRDKLMFSPLLARFGERTFPIGWRDFSRNIFVLFVQVGHNHRDILKNIGPH